MARPSFLFDPNRCTGCGACRLACTIQNRLAPDRSFRRIETYNARHHERAGVFHLSLACNHCEKPACLEACPARAYRRDPDTKAVLLTESRCIGCMYCTWACPYDAPDFDPVRGVMTKCTFCNERLGEGSSPACAELCPTGALGFSRLAEEETTHAVTGFPRTPLGPAIRITPILEQRRRPDLAASVKRPFLDLDAVLESRISLANEWTLVVFTLAVPLMVGLVTAGIFRGSPIEPLALLGAGALAMLLSATHLGRAERAAWSCLNFRTSPLSREIVTFGLFLAVSVGFLWLARSRPGGLELPGWAGILPVLAGFATLLFIDGVYRMVEPPGAVRLHSAHTFLTGLFLLGILGSYPILAMATGAVKLGLYLRRLGRTGRLLSVTRLGLGLLLPLLLWWMKPDGWTAFALLGILTGEVVDRCQFYQELEVTTPSRQMARDLQEELSG